MIRRIAVTASLLLGVALPAQAQSHVPPQPPHRTHPAGHVRPDSAQHTAMHALLHGTWTGTLHSSQGSSGTMTLSVAHDSLQVSRLQVTMDAGVRAAVARDVAIDGAKLAWTQDLAGGACKGSAVLTAPTPSAPETMQGSIVCESGETTFILRKASE